MNRDDEAAFREFVSVQMEQLRGLAYLTCGDWQLAEDAVCTALAKLYGRWHKVDRPESYARTMVVRAAVDEVRRPWWRREHAVGDKLPEPAVRDGTPDVIDRLTVLEAMRTLPVQQRAVLVLRYLEGRTVSETAEALRCPEGTVKTNTARGLARLRERLDVAEPLGTIAGPGYIERAS
ncbi:SigE family RNA polymerase sigma factor [Dactylosporangium vinaceum]|uniref:SigE family RNA polymerase sigma factor n=1 Tax=Dactylosporangium vinaceum TaxID=53362 RepID=A0ABV5MEW7_9ACTN|nr:SigE family RNA polymerase sigma factor [Dactylosporangium vinaceum]UAB97066.1 SigE family RNA polymerase sigma factor [Dactylosporangium vinaceum]